MDLVDVVDIGDGAVEVEVEGVRHHFRVTAGCAKAAVEGGSGSETLYIRSSLGQRTITKLPRYPRIAGAAEHQTANSPMPGQVLRVLVAVGQQVKAGDALIALEAMKMEQTIKATMDGVVGAILVKPGDIIAPGQKLVEIQSEKSNEHANTTATASS